MAHKLTEAIAAYFATANAQDVDGVSVCFTNDAVVYDEMQDRQGIAAIREWTEETGRKYRPVEAVNVTETAGQTIVTGRVSGDFPGSPVMLRHAFILQGDKIARLEIQ
jgi:ketosteroid isomerase-like protein